MVFLRAVFFEEVIFFVFLATSREIVGDCVVGEVGVEPDELVDDEVLELPEVLATVVFEELEGAEGMGCIVMSPNGISATSVSLVMGRARLASNANKMVAKY